MKETKTTTIVQRCPKYDKDYTNGFIVQWADSKYLVLDAEGNQVEAGTMLIIRDRIEFLSQLSEEQLLELTKQVKDAVNHELSKRPK